MKSMERKMDSEIDLKRLMEYLKVEEMEQKKVQHLEMMKVTPMKLAKVLAKVAVRKKRMG